MKNYFRAIYLMLFATAYIASDAYNLGVRINPEHIHAEPKAITSIKCFTVPSEPIAACHFRIWYADQQKDGPLMNIADAQNYEDLMIQNPFHNDTYYTAWYSHKEYFNNGWCGLHLYDVEGSHLVVGCRLTTVSNQSATKTMSLFYTDQDELELRENTEQLVVRAGDSVNISLKTKDLTQRLSKCTSTLANGDKVEVVDNGFGPNQVTPANSRHKPWLNQSECGFTIDNVTEEDNGVFYVLAESGPSVGAKVVTLIVSKPLSAPELVLDKDDFQVREKLTATCSEQEVRQPEVHWAWTFGGKKIREENLRYLFNADWIWPWQDRNISQSVTLILKEGDIGKVIECQVDDGKSGIVTTSRALAVYQDTTDAAVTESSTNPGLEASSQVVLQGEAFGGQTGVIIVVALGTLLALIMAAVFFLVFKRRACFKAKDGGLTSRLTNDDVIRRSRSQSSGIRTENVGSENDLPQKCQPPEAQCQNIQLQTLLPPEVQYQNTQLQTLLPPEVQYQNIQLQTFIPPEAQYQNIQLQTFLPPEPQHQKIQLQTFLPSEAQYQNMQHQTLLPQNAKYYYVQTEDIEN